MSPRRRVGADTAGLFTGPEPRTSRSWRILLATGAAALVAAASVAMCTVTLITHESHRRSVLKEVAVLDFVRSFTTEFLSPDPTGDKGANRYVDRMTAQTTGEFGRWWRDRRNEILIQVAQGPEVSAVVLDVGVERWNDDGSADVLVVATTATKGAKGEVVSEQKVRCLETASQEGGQWKISNFSPVL